MRRSASALICVCLLTASVSTRADAPPASAPASSAASQPAKELVAVKRSTVRPMLDLDGYLEAIDPLEVRVRPKQYQGDLTILSSATFGSAVKQGQTLLEIDPAPLKKQLAAADNELTSAKANASKAEADVKLGEQSDDLALKMQENEVATAEKALKWWEDVDGKAMITGADLAVKTTSANVEDQQDELDQLKKMYKSEELTNATADIVVKRALRQLDIYQISKGIQVARAGKTKDFDYNNSRQRYVFAIDQQKQALAALQASQAQAKVLRQTALATAKAAVDKSQQKVDELKADLEGLTVKAPSDGVVLYGQFTQGAWQNANWRLLRAGEKVQPATVLMTFVEPGKLRAMVDVPEAKVSWVKKDAAARVVPAAYPDAATDGKCSQVMPNGAPREAGQAFPMTIELAMVDPRLLPGEKAAAHIDLPAVRDVLTLPPAAVAHGRVRVAGDGGADAWRDVVVGFSDKEAVEIRSGLKEGDEVYPTAAK